MLYTCNVNEKKYKWSQLEPVAIIFPLGFYSLNYDMIKHVRCIITTLSKNLESP